MNEPALAVLYMPALPDFHLRWIEWGHAPASEDEDGIVLEFTGRFAVRDDGTIGWILAERGDHPERTVEELVL